MAPRGKELSKDMKDLIIKLFKEKKSVRVIGKTVDKSPATIQKIIEKFKVLGNTKNLARNGRPPKFSEQEKRIIIRKIKKNPKLSAPKLLTELSVETGKTCNPQTIRRVLHNAGYHGRNIRKKPYINKVNRQKRTNFAKKHLNYGETFWNTVIFSDESKYNIHGSDGREKVWRKPNAELDPINMSGTVKHGGGSVMVWGCMSSAGVGNLVFIDTIMDRFIYLDILKNNLKESARKMGLRRSYIFQQDNDPKHTSLIVKEWLLKNVQKQLRSPPQSPDMNPIEHLWEHLDRQIRKHVIRTKQDLKRVLQEEWNKIDPQVTQNLVKSMPSRMNAVIKAKGYPSKY